MRKVGSWRRLRWAATLAGLATVLVGVPLAASANPDVSGFELDGNAASSGAADWNSLGSPLDFTGFINDKTDASDVGYGSGSNKDINDVSTWSWKQGDVTPNKDDIVSAYASVYAEQNSLILYFGQTRLLDKNGDANVGFWFLQDKVGLGSNGAFTGTHKDGDVLVQSEFTNGGDVSSVRIYRWQSGSLQLVENQAECTGGKLGTADACAIVNKATISTSWAGNVTEPYFFEGGLNLSALFAQQVPCFSTFLTNTRTSQQNSAELKDFAFGSIDTCGSITVAKTATPSDGTDFDYSTTGSLSPSTFKLSSGGTRTFDKLGPGAYSVAEAAQSGSWAFDSLTCSTSGPGTSASINGQTANITLGFLGDVSCTYVNKRKPQVKVVKSLDPTTDPGKFNLQVNGQTKATDVGNGGDTGFVEVPAGQSVAVGELAGSGTDLGNYVSSISCDSGKGTGSGTSYSFTANYGDKVVCTITNHRKPEVEVVKNVVPASDSGKFNLLINGNVEKANATNGQDTGFKQVAAGSVTVGESAGTATTLSNYDSKVQCDSGKGSASPGTNYGFTASYGDRVTCTITNTRKATLTVVKHVINDNGGSKSASDFAIAVAGTNPTPSAFSGAESPGTTVVLGPGSYNVTETEDPAYAATYSAGCSGTLAAGASATCTVTNDDQAATLTVVKHVVNDNGGSASASSFTMTVNGVTAQGGNSFAGAESPGVTKTLTTLGSYNVSESSLAGYEQTSASADCSGTIALGEHKTCTIVNDDIGAKLIVIKHVVNDNGGTAVAGDFQLTVDDAGSNPPSFPGAEAPGTQVSVDPGSYSVSESGPAGYQMSQSADCSGTIALGQTKTCTVTNDDQAGTLVVIKHVINDDGGKASAADWTMNAAGPTPLSFAGAESPGTSSPVSAGAYTITESGGPDGYGLTYSGACDESGHVTVPLGQTRTCTLTNDDKAAMLIVKKVVVNDNGGTKIASDFSFQVNGGSAVSFEGDGQNELVVGAGTYSVTEPAVSGYATSYSNCSELVIPNGGAATCTITNDDIPATLVVKKVVVNDNGGTSVASDFSFQVNGGAAQKFEADGQNDLAVDAGTYDVTEPAVAGYTTTYNGCAGIKLTIGGSATCTVTNNDVPRGQGSISVSKSANPTTLKEPGGPVSYSVTITNTSADVKVSITNVVDDKFGDLDDDGGNGCFDVPINLKPGEHVNCSFQKTITGVGGTSHVNVVTVTGHDENGHSLTATDDARVDITERLIDLVMVKDATSPTPLNGNVDYTLTVTNKGPDTATNVQVADPAPAGITYLSANASQGSCTVSASIVSCNLGTMAAGQTVTISVVGKATTVGSHTNTATVTGSGGRETNPADNVDSAVTVVPAPLKPPVKKPTKPTSKPAKEIEYCLALTVTPKMVTANGKIDRVVVTVAAGPKRVKGVLVVVSGAGVKKAVRTNGRGVAVLRINPKKAGLITVSASETNQKLCGPKRIGVVGVFLPPLTG